jgi:hypothetical protein
MKWLARSIIAVVLIAGIGLALYSQKPATLPEPTATQSPTPEPSESEFSSPSPSPSPGENHYPVPTESGDTRSLPRVDESDSTIETELGQFIGKDRLSALFNLKNIARRIVVTIDNATKHDQISQEYSPFKPLEKNFHTEGKGENLVLSTENFSRYSLYVSLAKNVDTQKLAHLYVHFYPLFQSAFQDLGVKGYFNDRVIAAIDVVLGAPEINDTIKLVRAPIHPIYKFADEKLEALPAAQKVMLRMGTENALFIKMKLRELKELFTHLDQLDHR